MQQRSPSHSRLRQPGFAQSFAPAGPPSGDYYPAPLPAPLPYLPPPGGGAYMSYGLPAPPPAYAPSSPVMYMMGAPAPIYDPYAGAPQGPEDPGAFLAERGQVLDLLPESDKLQYARDLAAKNRRCVGAVCASSAAALPLLTLRIFYALN